MALLEYFNNLPNIVLLADSQAEEIVTMRDGRLGQISLRLLQSLIPNAGLQRGLVGLCNDKFERTYLAASHALSCIYI